MKLIYFLILYYPFHEVILKYSGLYGSGLFLARQWADLLLLVFFITAIVWRARRNHIKLGKRSILPWIVLFIVQSSLLVLFTEDNNNAIGFIEIYVLLRFSALFGAIILLAPAQKEIEFSLKLILISVFIQAAIGLTQNFAGDLFFDLFRPVDYSSIITEINRSFTSNRQTERQFLIGTAGDFISFAYILAVGIFVIQHRFHRPLAKTFLLVALYSILFLAGSRTIFLGTLFSHALFGIWRTRLERKLITILLYTFLAPMIFLFMQSLTVGMEYRYDKFSALFSSRIFEALLNQRLGVLLYVLPTYVVSGDFLIGFSPDRFHLVDHVASNYSAAPAILLETLSGTVEDLYLVCLFLYYGIFGFIALLALYISLWKMCSEVYSKTNRIIGGLGVSLLISGLFFGLGNQVFENRLFAFHFWLVMGFNASLVHSNSRRKHTAQAHIPSSVKTFDERA